MHAYWRNVFYGRYDNDCKSFVEKSPKTIVCLEPKGDLNKFITEPHN